nr:putative membrane fusion protein SilB [Nerophis lumbriciformis]
MPSAGSSPERQVLYYQAPMDSNFRRQEPGKSPMGMDLVPVYADQASADGEGVVSISPTIVNNLGVRTAQVQQSELSREIQTVGRIGYNEDTLYVIATRVDGWIERLAVNAAGDSVARGATLLELYSPTLVSAQREYLAALKSTNKLLQSASRERLAALGVSTGEIDRLTRERKVKQRIQLSAPAKGIVTRLAVREGQYVTAASDIMSIGSLDQVWLHAEVLERQAGWVSVGQRAQVELESLPGKIIEGEVDFVYPELDPTTRTLTARIRLNNESGTLRPNMFARATLLASDNASVLHIPRQAVIRGASTDRVVIMTDNHRFRSQPVTLGIESGERVEVTHGLSVNDRVVTSGQFLIDSESNISSALGRMTSTPGNGEHPMAPSKSNRLTTEPGQ